MLLPDKRGSESSEGDWRTSSYEDLTTDTLAAIEFLRSRDAVSISSIGVIGMSEGGRIAPIVATQSDELAFVVNMVGEGTRIIRVEALDRISSLAKEST